MSLWILLVNAVSTFCLVGLIWTVQLVHYPGFRYIDERTFPEFEAFHQKRISFVAIPLMIAEITTSMLLIWEPPEPIPTWMPVIGLALVGIIWLSTFALQMPLHTQLSKNKRAKTVRRLVATNWFRTIAWSGRGLLLSWVLLSMLMAGREDSILSKLQFPTTTPLQKTQALGSSNLHPISNLRELPLFSALR